MLGKNFNILLLGQIISLLGNGVQRFALSLYILDLTGSGRVFSAVLAISMIPYVLLAPLAGEMADHFDRKKNMIVLDFISAALCLVFVCLTHMETGSVFYAGILIFLLSVIACLYSPSVTASIPQVVGKEQLLRANALVTQVSSLANFIGPIIAGILYGNIGIAGIVMINGISFFLSAIMELFLKLPDRRTKKSKYLLKFKAGFRGMYHTAKELHKKTPVVLTIISSYGLYNILIYPVISVFTPYYIRIVLGISATLYGVLEGVMLFGMLFGSILLAVFPTRFQIQSIKRILFLMPVSVLLIAGMTVVLKGGFGQSIFLALCGAIIMFALGLSNVMTLSYIQRVVAVDSLGRTSALSTAVATMTIPIGQLLFGWVMDSKVPVFIWLLPVALLCFAVSYRLGKRLALCHE